MDRLFCMQVFVRVVEHGSFSRAADSLGIARSSATEALAQLERRLGTRLLHRTTRRVSATDEGLIYYDSCLRILDEVAEAEDELTGRRQCARGRLRVSVPQSFVNGVFFPALTAFLHDYPELDVEIILTDRAVNLVEEGIDCAIRGLEIPPDADLVARHMSDANWLTCASPRYCEAHGTPRTIADLARHNCIRFVSQSNGRPRDWQFTTEAGVVRHEPHGNLRLTSFDAAIRAAVAGAGVAQVPDALGVPAVVSGKLRPLLTGHLAPAPPLMLIYPGNRYVTTKVRAFRDHMCKLFPRDGFWSEIAPYCDPPEANDNASARIADGVAPAEMPLASTADSLTAQP